MGKNNKEIIKSKKDLKEWLEYELKKYKFNYSSLVGFIRLLFRTDEVAILVSHQILLRKCEYFLNTGKKIRYIFKKLKLRKLQNKYGLHVPFNCFGKGLKIVHLSPILINEKVKAGKDCVLIGNNYIVAAHGSYYPELGDNVIVCVGAIILGDVKIANGVTVGAGAVVVKSAEKEGSTLIGVPAHVVNKE